MPSSILSMSIVETQNVPIIIGNTSSFNVSIQNLSSSQRLYNLGISLTLPDGMVLSSSTIPQTSSITNVDNSVTYSWINIKDLAPMEINFSFSITVKCNTKFKNGSTIPFGYNFSGINVECQVDTMPRGAYDIGNEVITQQISMTYVTVRFASTITTSEKVLKGAGTSASLNDYTQVTTATCKVLNNSISTSLVNISILLQDGIRYIGNITIYGTDASKFSSPTISTVNINGTIYTQLYYGNVNLSINSNTTLTFSYAVWNQYNNNQGSFIVHGTMLNMLINMTSADPLITSSSNSSTSFAAMDLIITTSTNRPTVDVQTSFTYTYVFKVGQYYNIQNIIVNYFIPDGILYLSSAPSPTSAVNNPTLQGYYLTYNFSLATQNSTKTVAIYAKIDSYYRYKLDIQSLNLPVVAYDPFLATANILGTLVGPFTQVSDSSSVSSNIGVGTITKQFIKGYYKDGTPKTINTLAPGDFAEYLLTYNASTLQATQKGIYIDDFFPLSADPIDSLNYVYTNITPIKPPQLISPHGVDFYYGDLSGLSTCTIDFKIPIASLGSSARNANLMKLKGINTYGYAYSNRSQVNINIGSPNLSLTKSVSGPNKSAIQANEIYTYTVTISNSNNLGSETDAFDFTLNDTLSSSWSALNPNSINVTGTGSYNSPIIQSNNIVVYINKLSPGQFITLTYQVNISSILAPGVNITTTATNTNPYSQIYNASSTNFQYSNLNKSVSVTLSSSAIDITKTNFPNTFKVGSPITYTLTITVPQGTIAYGLYGKDILPSGGQLYLGPSYKNGILITPTVSSNTITLPTEGTVDARLSVQTISYIITAKINNANKSINTTTSTQTNTFQCLYQQIQSGSFSTISKSLTVTINHPNLLMTLSAIDKTTSTLYTKTATINTNSIVQFKLNFQNNSLINLSNGTIQIPINSNFLFYSIDTTVLCSATYNISSKTIIITVPSLNPSVSGYIAFTVIPLSTLNSGTTINTQATAISYYNDISPTKVYSGEQSNVLSCLLQPGVSLLPDPLYKINDSTSFYVTPPGNTAIILNYFKNTGGGYDSFTLEIQKVNINYSLYINDIKIADIPSNTLYQEDLPQIANLAPNETAIIKITAAIPADQPLGIGYNFIVTAISKTSPYPSQTVLNIDPNPF
ncbi:isopeptide-forming domain-containing fimbrial protein [Romboutsia lituseburensis]|uniref:isopeptide-forming domain-containing fimbrial protein n=1 Tax=Romboutsia lituseburensis TaxID=1537 RepID=UPI00215B1170|nr:isopeptide-forming domain-containing fimbrial protein [Romboutsia lituseburensis]MCR8746290.1 isopeptide-forming domain-containing fimbrial protein [Romboutsia lituseburensis]